MLYSFKNVHVVIVNEVNMCDRFLEMKFLNSKKVNNQKTVYYFVSKEKLLIKNSFCFDFLCDTSYNVTCT